MQPFIPKKPDTMYLGNEKGEVLYLREGLFKDSLLITPDHAEYQRLVNLLDGEPQKLYTKIDIEYKFLLDIYKEGTTV